MATTHAGWIVTEDLRGRPLEEQHIGAVSPSMTPESYLRLADAAREHDLEPLIHKISTKGANGAERFLADPRLRNPRNIVARALSPVWIGMRGVIGMIRWGAKRGRNIFRRQRGLNPPTAMRSAAPTKAPAATNAAPTSRPEPVGEQRVQEAPTKAANPPAPAYWDRAHEWEIHNAQGEVLYRGQAIGVEGDNVAAQKARRAPLDEIPGLPRDASIRWRDQPDWAATGVSAAAAARSVIHVAGAALADGGINWGSVRQAAADARVVVQGSASAEQSPLDAAIARMRARHGGRDPDVAVVQSALNRMSERHGQEAPTVNASTTTETEVTAEATVPEVVDAEAAQAAVNRMSERHGQEAPTVNGSTTSEPEVAASEVVESEGPQYRDEDIPVLDPPADYEQVVRL
ncbi:MAG: hypothetical protein Q4F67_03050 [Propionibacteriaceae bacterium]|nr:hypothetical protein [Propionibacteriaceae bacterium]